MSNEKVIRKYLRYSAMHLDPPEGSPCDIFGVVVATGRGKIGWSLISDKEKIGVVTKVKKDKDGNIEETKTWGVSPRNCDLAVERAERGLGGPIPNHDLKKIILEWAIGEIVTRSYLYFKDNK